MKLEWVRVRSYKSIQDSGVIKFAPGFNVIIGANNAGKTSLLQALSLRLDNQAHLSLETVPFPGTNPGAQSSVDFGFRVDNEEAVLLLRFKIPKFHLVFERTKDSGQESRRARALLRQGFSIAATYAPDSISQASIPGLTEPSETGTIVEFVADRATGKVDDGKVVGTGSRGGSLPNDLALRFRAGIYVFNAERLRLAQAQIKADTVLKPDASNLAQVLHRLQSNPAKYRQLMGYVREIFPSITQVTAPEDSNSNAVVRVWTTDPELQREDLSFRLDECGSGIGQVLAMLYVLVDSDQPRVIAIDEPQSFLHPGAVRKLFEIFALHPRHQFIVTTHSPSVVTAANVDEIVRVALEGPRTVASVAALSDLQSIRELLANVGARFSDVFGADRVLWVEGRTEEICYPLIVTQVAHQPLRGSVVVGLVNTGDLNTKQARVVMEIYDRLSRAGALMPPSVGLLLDRENRTDTEQRELEEWSHGRISFIGRRMTENYLLHASAIASVMNTTNGFRATLVSREEVEACIAGRSKELGMKADAFSVPWLETVDGAGILEHLFDALSEHRVQYRKGEHGEAITRELIKKDPDFLKPLAITIAKKLAQ